MTTNTTSTDIVTVTLGDEFYSYEKRDLDLANRDELAELENTARVVMGERTRGPARTKTLAVERCWSVLSRLSEAQTAAQAAEASTLTEEETAALEAPVDPVTEPDLAATLSGDATEAEVVEAARRGRLVHANLPTSHLEGEINATQASRYDEVLQGLQARFGEAHQGVLVHASHVFGVGGRMITEFCTWKDGRLADRRVVNFGRRGGVQLLLKQPGAVTTINEYHHEVHTVAKAVETDAGQEG